MEDISLTDINQDLNIDKDNLDMECMDQPRKFMKWATDYAKALQLRDEAKRRLVIIKSNVNLDIRTRPQDYGIDKATEGSINAAIESNEEVNKAEQEVSDAQYAVNIYSAAKEALDQRRAMLERLVSLYLSGYYAQPKLQSEFVGEVVDKNTEAQKTLLNARRKRE